MRGIRPSVSLYNFLVGISRDGELPGEHYRAKVRRSSRFIEFLCLVVSASLVMNILASFLSSDRPNISALIVQVVGGSLLLKAAYTLYFLSQSVKDEAEQRDGESYYRYLTVAKEQRPIRKGAARLMCYGLIGFILIVLPLLWRIGAQIVPHVPSYRKDVVSDSNGVENEEGYGTSQEAGLSQGDKLPQIERKEKAPLDHQDITEPNNCSRSVLHFGQQSDNSAVDGGRTDSGIGNEQMAGDVNIVPMTDSDEDVNACSSRPIEELFLKKDPNSPNECK